MRGFLASLLLQLVLGGLGIWLTGVWGGLACIIIATLLYGVWQEVNVRRLLNWLRSGGRDEEMPELSGEFADIAEYLRRVIRQKNTELSVADRRLDELFSMLQASPNGVLLLNEHGLIEWFNDIAACHFGFDSMRDRYQFLGNLLRDPVFSAYLAEQDYSHSITIDGRGSTSSRPVRVSVQIYAYGEGKLLILSQDITAIEQADVMRRDFVANVSHEIRTPLTVLSGFIETLSTLNFSEEERLYYLNKMANQATRMRQLVDDLLVLSRLEGSPLPPTDEWVSVSSLFLQCAEEAEALSSLLNKGKISHRIILPEANHIDGCEIAGVDKELRGAFSNLLNNAVRYTPAGETITLQWNRLAHGGFYFSVQDTGPGIDSSYLPRLTERFYRVDKGRSRETGGTGLGLAIVKHVAQRHGGSLDIKSQLGKGSTFSITFPASRVRCLEASNLAQ